MGHCGGFAFGVAKRLRAGMSSAGLRRKPQPRAYRPTGAKRRLRDTMPVDGLRRAKESESLGNEVRRLRAAIAAGEGQSPEIGGGVGPLLRKTRWTAARPPGVHLLLRGLLLFRFLQQPHHFGVVLVGRKLLLPLPSIIKRRYTYPILDVWTGSMP
jgi:hypothetical protein